MSEAKRWARGRRGKPVPAQPRNPARETRWLVDADLAPAVMHRIRRISMDEHAGGDEVGSLHLGKVFRSCWRWENVRKDEESERHTKADAEHSAEDEARDAPPEPVHESFSCVRVWL